MNIGDRARGNTIGRKSYEWYIWTRCPDCGFERYVRKADIEKHTRCLVCAHASLRHSNSPSWKGGRVVEPDGYIALTLKRDDPFYSMTDNSGQVFEHRYVMAKKLGRPLTKEEFVHHINGIRSDNRIENLAVVTKTNHKTNTLLNRVLYLEERDRLHQLRIIQLEADIVELRAQLEESYVRK